jgi:hypothetical protein
LYRVVKNNNKLPTEGQKEPDGREGRHNAVDIGNLAVATKADDLSFADVHLLEGKRGTVTVTVTMVMAMPKNKCVHYKKNMLHLHDTC